MPRVLIVDHDEQMVRLMSWILGEAGFDVTAIAAASAADERVKMDQPDAVVIRTGAGGGDARAAIAECRRLCPESKILELAYRADARRSGADAALPMPFDADALIDCLRALPDAETADR